MLRNLRVYTISVDLHRAAEKSQIPAYLKRQLLKAAVELAGERHFALARLADQVGAALYRFCNPKR